MKGSKPRLVVDNGVELNADAAPDWMSPEPGEKSGQHDLFASLDI